MQCLENHRLMEFLDRCLLIVFIVPLGVYKPVYLSMSEKLPCFKFLGQVAGLNDCFDSS
jgi:hypothetical protein